MEEQLKAAGNRLLQPPDSLGELLPLLDVSPKNSLFDFMMRTVIDFLFLFKEIFILFFHLND